MGRRSNYCPRCGEEAWFEIIICDGCGAEFCDECGSGQEIDHETCRRCEPPVTPPEPKRGPLMLCGAKIKTESAILFQGFTGEWAVRVDMAEPADGLQPIVLVPGLTEAQAFSLRNDINAIRHGGAWTVTSEGKLKDAGPSAKRIPFLRRLAPSLAPAPADQEAK